MKIKYKFNLIEKDNFKYVEPEGPRNPYGPKGKMG